MAVLARSGSNDNGMIRRVTKRGNAPTIHSRVVPAEWCRNDLFSRSSIIPWQNETARMRTGWKKWECFLRGYKNQLWSLTFSTLNLQCFSRASAARRLAAQLIVVLRPCMCISISGTTYVMKLGICQNARMYGHARINTGDFFTLHCRTFPKYFCPPCTQGRSVC